METRKNPPTDTRPSLAVSAQTTAKQGRQRRTNDFLTIIIPIYNAYDDLLLCLDSVARHTRVDHPVLLIDDASTDERIWPLLQQWTASHSNFRSVRNDVNLGYTTTINRACQLVGLGDIILLNSDTIVPPHWVEQLAACAYSRPDVATVTAISNAAGAFSVPVKNAVNSLPRGWKLEEMAALIERISRRIWPSVPTGNGFCMYITAAARVVTGLFDSENFPKGYGEENDFCLRASKFALVHLIDDATYVFHKRSASFGGAKSALLQRSRAVLDHLHPEYNQLLKDWMEHDLLDPFRAELAREIGAGTHAATESVLPREGRPCLLFISHHYGGGTGFPAEDLLSQMTRKYRGLLLLAALESFTLYERLDSRGLTPVRRYAFADRWSFDRPMTADRQEVAREICTDYDVAWAHVCHLLATDPQLLAILRKAGAWIVSTADIASDPTDFSEITRSSVGIDKP